MLLGLLLRLQELEDGVTRRDDDNDDNGQGWVAMDNNAGECDVCRTAVACACIVV